MLYESFKAFDKNNDGKISKDELYEGYRKIYKSMGEEELKKEVDNAFK
jgi:Ca2+-binding EF-hand superfamily protein